jgi:hypothetical protein
MQSSPLQAETINFVGVQQLSLRAPLQKASQLLLEAYTSLGQVHCTRIEHALAVEHAR